MAARKDITGLKFGRLTALTLTKRDRFKIGVWKCRCECGNECEVRLCSLTAGSTKSCGCYNNEVRSERILRTQPSRTHGLSKHPLYQTWSTMKSRCYNENATKFKLYGARGIKVCDRWRESFENFLSDMGERPEGKTLDRVDCNGDYSPENCKWSSHSEQNLNRRHVTVQDSLTKSHNE